LLTSSHLWLVLALTVAAGAAGAQEGQRARSVLLNGPWQFAVGTGDEHAEAAAGQARLTWKPVELPGAFMPWNQETVSSTAFVWARRTFQASPEDARALAVLHWNRISIGATAFINGRKVGHHDPTGPYQAVIPPGVVHEGANEIVLKIAGTLGAPKAASGFLLVPAGFGCRGEMPEVTDDVWIDFADGAYMKWVLAIPDLAGGRVTFRVTPTGLERLDNLTLRARARPWPAGAVVGTGEAAARLVPDPDPLGGEHFRVEVPLSEVKPWTYEDCNLYLAEVSLLRGERLLDEATIRFGMREIGVAERNYKLNGRNLWLRGSNLVFEWDWADTITGHEFDYLVTEAREMSMNSFRTHTRPVPPLWANIADEHGTMILAEFPVLYNYQDYQFTPAELEIWHRNCLLDAAGWMSRLWNHPAVIMWVLSNESNRDNEWEEGPFQDFVNALDPTRPTLRTGTSGTRDNYDVHTCGNITDTAEGNLQPGIQGWFATAGDRTTTNTEYMNFFGHPKTQWSGVADERADQLAVAQIGAEHTEAMRRARVDGIWPYMYAGWTRTRLAARVRETGQGSAVWKATFAAPASAAWHSSLSPVLASLDLFDASYRTGQSVTTNLYLINDSWHDASIHVDLLLTKECPEYIPEAECLERPLAQWSFEYSLPADSIRSTLVTWTLPEEEGSYWLTARTTGVPGRPVLSQRFVRAVGPTQLPATVRERTFVLLGADEGARAWFAGKGLQTTTGAAGLDPARHFVLVWDPARLSPDERASAPALCDFAAQGGRIVVLGTRHWDWRDLCDMHVPASSPFSRVYPHGGVDHPLLTGVEPSWLIRWNGLPGTVAVAAIEGPAVEAGRALLWAVEPKRTVAAEVPAAQGGGRALFCQLDLRNHVASGSKTYDPVAERVLVNLLAQ
jgi:hypothetical protein